LVISFELDVVNHDLRTVQNDRLRGIVCLHDKNTGNHTCAWTVTHITHFILCHML